MTNYELDLQFKGAKQRTDAWHELGLFVAWHVAQLSRTPKSKKLPDLAELIKRFRADRKPVKVTKRQQRAVFQQIADQFGLQVKRVPRKKL